MRTDFEKWVVELKEELQRRREVIVDLENQRDQLILENHRLRGEMAVLINRIHLLS